ncbi:Asp23/Gls24 family envelope stress response protein [Streptosporangium sp. 'caverna']|uniref:Asp23/Gls24 family envelope stress response protein n=1 Tax=Streptosporangium sp. 'caverna' TaxID=2202249 RepID=UPI000D7E9F97|nr:Asp23/Gls24 family envelope stress response protein [Streptosporangium sp. 'caverna']AWS42330.1 Asp23/Gls24 family envelope stress response protein [Streptosporangium sp. 'caverna']
MTDVSVEDLTEKTESPAEAGTADGPHSPDPSAPSDLSGLSEPAAAESPVKGRIKVADEVVEKVAALATLEVAGVADLGGDFARAMESVRERIGIGTRNGTQGVSAQVVQDRTIAVVAVDVTIVVEYGHVVMEVANAVKTNVSHTVSRMLGMQVIEVNVTVDDVRLPGERVPAPPADGSEES